MTVVVVITPVDSSLSATTHLLVTS